MFGLGGGVLSWITSFIRERTQTVVFGGERSATSRVSSGVPQGSVLGPVLFLLYTADVLQITQRHGLKSHSYADDIQLYCSGKAATGQIMNARMVCVHRGNQWMDDGESIET